MLLMIDNYDSFTYNIVQYLHELQQEVQVFCNDAISIAEIHALKPDAIVLGPGPGTPEQAGITLDIIQQFAGKLPILGICLGHQAIAAAFGGRIVRAQQVMHGRVSPIQHDGKGVFVNLANPFNATRYHSLVVEQSSLPQCLEVTAWSKTKDIKTKVISKSNTGIINTSKSVHTKNNVNQPSTAEIMGLRHRELPIEGVQFHPESILSESGHQLLSNFLQHIVLPHSSQF